VLEVDGRFASASAGDDIHPPMVKVIATVDRLRQDTEKTSERSNGLWVEYKTGGRGSRSAFSSNAIVY